MIQDSTTITLKEAEKCSEAVLRRLLEFALDRDPSGKRIRQYPPADKTSVIIQLAWLGVVT